jgi:hypothetical protein
MARMGLKPVVRVHGWVWVYRTMFINSANSQLKSFGIHGGRWYTRQMHCTKNLKQIFPEMKLRGLVTNFSIHVSVMRFLYYHDRSANAKQQNRRTDHGNYKSLTDTWMQKLGTRPPSFISGNICFEFSVKCSQRYLSKVSTYNYIKLRRGELVVLPVLAKKRWLGSKKGKDSYES